MTFFLGVIFFIDVSPLYSIVILIIKILKNKKYIKCMIDILDNTDR